MIFWKNAGTFRARMYLMMRSSVCLRSAASMSRLESAEEALPMMTEYIMRPSRIITTEKMISSLDLGTMFMPTDVVAATAQKMDHQYCDSVGMLAYPGNGTHVSVSERQAGVGK